MQAAQRRRSNRERSETTQGALVAAARRLFLEKPYADVSTPEVVAAAGVTRGALYHHFADKEALFRAVVEAESAAVAAEIERAAVPLSPSPVAALVTGGEAFLVAMREPGRVRLLLLDGPAVLGRLAMDEIDMRHGGRTLREGLAAAMAAGALRKLPVDAAAAILSAAYDRAALAIDAGANSRDYKRALATLIKGLAGDGA